MDMNQKFQFLSVAWVDAVRSAIERLLAGVDLDGLDFAISEEVTGAPPGVRPHQAETVGWHLRIRDGRIEVGYQPLADADIRVVVDYRTHHDLARRLWAGDAAAMASARALRQQATAEGRLRTEGDLSKAPSVIRDLAFRLHDPVAMLTE
jgi:hypothetical protein